MSLVIRIVQRATGEPTSDDGQYLEQFDAHPLPHGIVKLTREKRHARRFIGLREAVDFWKQTHGVRPDGKPNRPLTAWTITFEDAE